MAEYKLVISDPKKGKSMQKEVKDDDAKHFKGLKIGDTIKGELIDLPGYELTITGGSDAAGFPMRKDVSGTGKVQIFAFQGIGVHNKKRKPNPKKKGWRTMKGMRQKKTIAGNTIHDKTAQINLKITKQGSKPLFEEAKPEEAPAEAAPKKEPKAKEEPIEESEEETSKEDEDVEEIEKKIAEDEKEISDLDKEEEDLEKEMKDLDDEDSEEKEE